MRLIYIKIKSYIYLKRRFSKLSKFYILYMLFRINTDRSKIYIECFDDNMKSINFN